MAIKISNNSNIPGTPQQDVLIGRGGANTLRGKGEDDFLWGRGGDDTFRGGAGDDAYKGGGDNDTFLDQTNNGDDIILDFTSGADQVRLRDLTQAQLTDIADSAGSNPNRINAADNGVEVVFGFNESTMVIDFGAVDGSPGTDTLTLAGVSSLDVGSGADIFV
jgi:serralysin